MNCLSCASANMLEERGVHQLTEPSAVLINVPIRKCLTCGDREIVIPEIGKLHNILQLWIVQKKYPLAPNEISFLRKHVNHTGESFADVMGVAKETVSRWENGHLRPSAQADRLMRFLLGAQPYMETAQRLMLEIDSTADPKPLMMVCRYDDNNELVDWSPAE